MIDCQKTPYIFLLFFFLFFLNTLSTALSFDLSQPELEAPDTPSPSQPSFEPPTREEIDASKRLEKLKLEGKTLHGVVLVEDLIPFHANTYIDQPSLELCSIPARFSDLLRQQLSNSEFEPIAPRYSKEYPEAKKLNLTIDTIVSLKGSRQGKKRIEVQGSLYNQKNQKSFSFRATHWFNNGLFSSQKLNCKHIEKGLKSLNTEIVGWLKKPSHNAMLSSQ